MQSGHNFKIVNHVSRNFKLKKNTVHPQKKTHSSKKTEACFMMEGIDQNRMRLQISERLKQNSGIISTDKENE